VGNKLDLNVDMKLRILLLAVFLDQLLKTFTKLCPVLLFS
jgi:hypothetical protein